MWGSMEREKAASGWLGVRRYRDWRVMLRIGDKVVAPRLVVFDKDGTLIAFEALWHTWFERVWAAVEVHLPQTAEARQGLAGTLGFDLVTRAWDPLGPLTLAATGEVVVLIASQLYRYAGLAWPAALDLVERAHRASYDSLPLDELVHPIGDVAGLLGRMRGAGLKLAIATADDRAPTLEAIERLGLTEHWDAIICGDDGFAHKPAPDLALEVCRRLDVAPAEAIMVGDTVGDMVMARRAGYLLGVAVTSGALGPEALAPYADVVVDTIHDIVIIDQDGGQP